MNNKVSFSISKVNKLKEDDRFIYLEIYLALVGLNSNGSFISKDSYEASKDTLEYIPICGKLNFLKNDFLEHEDEELKCLGVILSDKDNNYKYETITDENTGIERVMVVADGIIFKEYTKEESKVILNDMAKGTSLEIEILEKRFEDGIFYYDKFKYQSLVILGDSYAPGMKGCHLDVASNYKQFYSKDIEKIKQMFSLSKANKIDARNFKECEVDIVKFDKVKFVKNLGMTANEVWKKFESVCRKEMYKEGEYEYSKYYMRDYDDKYVYVVDYSDKYKLKAIPYVMDNKDVSMDFANVKNARIRPFVEESNFEEFVSYKDEYDYFANMKKDGFINETKEKLTLEFSKKEKEAKESFNAQLEEKQNSIVQIGQELDVLKSRFAAKESEADVFKAENEKLRGQFLDFAKEKRLAEAENIFSKYSTRISEEEKVSLFSKLDDIENIKDFEKEVKAFVCDKYEEELKGKSGKATFSQLGIIKPGNQFSNKANWIDYYKEYEKEGDK